jgi:hypothetical protein
VIGISGGGPSRRPRSIKDCRARCGGGGGERGRRRIKKGRRSVHYVKI